MNGRLAGRIALITGAASGIGRATALLFAQEGARVAALDLDEARVRETGGEIAQQGGTCLPLAADVRDPQTVDRALRSIEEKFGGLHILVNNAGIARKKLFDQMSVKDWDEVWETNLTGTLACVRSGLRLLKKQRGGKIINMASVEVYSHSRKLTAYAASKGAIASFSRALAVELACDGMCVNYICPGFIKTEMTRPYYERWLSRKFIERITPLRRLGEPEDVARVALFLASSDADFVTGQGIVVDGGLTLKTL
jgi:3-oxoacyl-[acyl-carrier protein] reductase